jgi:hypothetical protein
MSGALPPREARNLEDGFIEWTEHKAAVLGERVRAQKAQRTAEFARLKSDMLPGAPKRQLSQESEHNATSRSPAEAGIRANMSSRHWMPSLPSPQELVSGSLIPHSSPFGGSGQSAGTTNETIRGLQAQLQNVTRIRERLEYDLAEKDQRIRDLEDQLREVQEHRIRASGIEHDTEVSGWKTAYRLLTDLPRPAEDEEHHLWSADSR